MNFAYEAMTLDGRLISDRIEASSEREAAEALRTRGLMVTRVRGAGEPVAAEQFGSRTRISGLDLVMFTRQMRMLLESGSAVVPALAAIEAQSSRPALRALVKDVREHVEMGGALSEAFQKHPRVFRPVYWSMIAAGESSGAMSQAFARLSQLLERQQRATRAVVSAMVYPALLALMCLSAVTSLILFVVPRFGDLFSNLRMPMPIYTQLLFALSAQIRENWILCSLAPPALIVALIAALRLDWVRARIEALIPNVPIVGRVYSRVVLARVLRVWAAMLRCHVPLLDTIQHSAAVAGSARLRAILANLEERVAGGGRMGRALVESGWVEPVVASAIATGEENGRLTESVEFVATWVDEDNDQLIATATRIVEPVMLALMGAIVGAVALALFLPLFDMATAGR